MAPPYDLLGRMRRSKAGWRPRDLERLYLGFGFGRVEGSKHTVYSHPSYPDLRATVKRADPLPPSYAADAVRLVDALLTRQAKE